MKRSILASLFAVCALTSCETAHNAAVTTFRVIDAPAAYVRRKLEVDEQPQQTTTTTTVTETAAYPAGAAYPQAQPQPPPGSVQMVPAPPPPPVSAQRQVVGTERTRQTEPQPEAQPSATPRLARTSSTPSESRTSEPKASASPRAAASQTSSLPYANPVPGKPGYVFSPYDKNGGYVDVTGYAPGSKVKDPYTGKIFLVP
jgi:type IV secretory pathway VirB10-like protein